MIFGTTGAWTQEWNYNDIAKECPLTPEESSCGSVVPLTVMFGTSWKFSGVCSVLVCLEMFGCNPPKLNVHTGEVVEVLSQGLIRHPRYGIFGTQRFRGPEWIAG
jgi:hypothetical protein